MLSLHYFKLTNASYAEYKRVFMRKAIVIFMVLLCTIQVFSANSALEFSKGKQIVRSQVCYTSLSNEASRLMQREHKTSLHQLIYEHQYTFEMMMFAACSAGQTGGKVWQDIDNDGVKDALETIGLADVTVTAYDTAGTVIGTAITDANGQYTFGILAPAPSVTRPVRVEFSNWPVTYLPTFNGTDGRTDVQFITAPECNVDFGLIYGPDFCQVNPFLVTPCYANGAVDSGGLTDVLLRWSYNNSGTATLDKTAIAAKSEIGSVWGVAYSKSRKKVYTATVLKRHVGVRGSLGAIYQTDIAGGGSSLLLNVPNAGTIGSDVSRGLKTATLPNVDSATLGRVMKVGLGDLEISDDEDTLFVVNLNNKKLIRIDVASGTIIDSLSVPNPCNISKGTNRPFALGYNKGKLYVGLVCDASISAVVADLSAYVYRLDGSTFTQVLTFPLNYNKEAAAVPNSPSRDGWFGWSDDYATISIIFGGARRLIYPQPVLSDIEFDLSGNMILGFLDRTGFQGGFQNLAPMSMPTTGTAEFITISGGDLLRATVSGGVYTLEANPGTGEFFNDDSPVTDHDEQSLGGVAVSLLTGEVVITSFDPNAIGGSGAFHTSGVTFLNASTGAQTDNYRLVNFSADASTFGKGNSLGDLELICDPMPIQIGNYVWIDKDGDGVQDPQEPKLPGVIVQLYDRNGVLVGQDTTNANGEYYFDQTKVDTLDFAGTPGTGFTGMSPNTAYYIVIGKVGSQFNTGTNELSIGGLNYIITQPNTGAGSTPDQNDNDGTLLTGLTGGLTMINGLPGLLITSPPSGSNHTFDFGFAPAPCKINVVSALFSPCYDSNGNTPGGTSVVNLSVNVDWDNRPGMDSIQVSVPGATPATRKIITGGNGGTGSVQFQVPSNGSSLTINATFINNITCTDDSIVVSPSSNCLNTACQAGNTGGTVWVDANNDGIQDAGEVQGVSSGVTVRAYDCNGNLVATTTPDALGQYTFGTIPAGSFPIRVEFSGWPAPYVPSFHGTDGGTDVQIIAVPECNVDFGLVNPGDYCQANPLFAVVCFTRNNDPNTDQTIIFMDDNNSRAFTPISTSDASNNWSTPSGANAGNYPIPVKYEASNKGEVGTTFGLAWDKYSKKLFSGAYMRAYSPMNSNVSANGFGEGVIFQIAINNTTASAPSVWLDLETLFGDNIAGSFVADAAYPGPLVFGRTGNKPNKVGFTGLGSMAVSSDGKQMYVVNLNTQEVFVIPIGANGAAPTMSSQIKRFPIPNAECPGNWPDGRPYRSALGLGIHPQTGRVFVSTTCTGPTLNDLKGVIYSFDPSDNTPSVADFTKEIEIPLNIDIPATNPNVALWYNQIVHPWDSVVSNSEFYPNNSSNAAQHTQPWLAEIGFDLQPNGTYGMVVGERNRYHDLINSSFYVTGGELFKVCNSGTNSSPVWALENNGVCGSETSVVNWTFNLATKAGSNTSATNRFFKTVGREGTFGAGTLLILPGTNEVIMPTMDNVYNSGTSGIGWLSTTSGDRIKDNRILGDFTSAGYEANNFTKANNWADIEALCLPLPIQIGNKLWEDLDADGVQDPCEPPLAWVVVELYDKNGVLVGRDTTGNDGEYYFDNTNVDTLDFAGTPTTGFTGMSPNQQYYVVIGGTSGQFNITTKVLSADGIQTKLTVTNTGEGAHPDQNDNDGSILTNLTGGLSTINGFPGSVVTTPTQGADHTFDYGFAPECKISIQNIVVSCSNDTIFTVSFNAGWINPNFATVGPINIYINGALASTIPTPVRADTVMVGPFAVHGPAYAVPIRIQFGGDTSCNETSSVDLIACGTPCAATPTSTGGTVFQDYNNNGRDTVTEPGQENVLVKLYDCDGNLVCQTYTNANGEWTCTGLTAGDQYRVEFSTPLQPWLQPSFTGTNNKSNVQFIVPGTCTVDYGVIDPEDYCQFNPRWVTGCYVNGLANLTDAAFISQNYNASGLSSVTPYTKVGTTDDIGSTWGIAYNNITKRVFTSSYLKRHVGLADGPGFVYYFNFSGVTPTVPEGKFDLQGIMPANGGPAINLGSLCRQSATDGDPNATCLPLGGAAADYTLGAKGAQNRDLDAFAKVGTMSYGDADVDPKTGKLWLTNLYQKALISVDVSGVIPGVVNQYLLTDIPGFPNCPGGNTRPFALAFHQGLGYIGVICDASFSQSISDLHAYVLSFNPANPMGGLTNVLDFNLGYKLINQLSGRTWNPWISTYAQLPGGVPLHPQPILSDIEFGPDNSMILGLRDRWGDMAAVGNLIPALGGGTFANSISTGDILKACFNNGVWIMEGFPGGCPVSATSGGTGVNANGEFFKDTRADTWDEGGEGGLALIPGTGEVVTTFTDPFGGGVPPNGAPYLDGQGLQFFSTSTGSITDYYQVYHQQFPLFGKGAGLSDIQFICAPPPIQIGNYVWQDNDEDGVQDACEPPIPNLFVTLFKKNANGTKTFVAVDTTDVNGNYYFNNVLKDTTYVIVFGYNGLTMISQVDPATGTVTIAGKQYKITDPNSSTEGIPDINDSDADTMSMSGLVGPFPVITVTPDKTDHTFDAGFVKKDIHDVALKKVLDMPNSGIMVGSNITFSIWVYNQGTANLDTVKVTDYIPAGYTFTGGGPNAGWTGAAPLVVYTATSSNVFDPGGLIPGDSAEIMIILKVAPGATTRNTVNLAEVSYSHDVAGLTGANDKDSKPDQIPNNDAGADTSKTGTPADNYIKGKGNGPVSSGVDSTDEDDADPAGIPIFDLALAKTVDPVSLAAAGGSFEATETVIFKIKVYNQGNVAAHNVVIKDTFPCGLAFNGLMSPGWIAGPRSATYTIAGTILPDSCIIVPIAFMVKASSDVVTDCAANPTVIPGKPFQNYSFIVSAKDTANATITTDFDSPYNSFSVNEAGTNPNVPGDNDVLSMTDATVGSQDDNDPANLDVFDLALSKVLITPIPMTGFAPNDVVTFKICVFNQGNIRSTGVQITDYIPNGYIFSNAFPNNTNWSVAGNVATYNIGAAEISGNDTLEFGDSVCINIDLQLQAGTNYVNVAEISGAAALVPDTSATPTPGVFVEIATTGDNDSKFDTNPLNNGGGSPGLPSDAMTSSPTDPSVLGTGTGTPGSSLAATDQDNADPALVPIVDFALKKVISPVETSPFKVGDTVSFDITVYNQGTISGTGFLINDYVPSHLSLNNAINPGWSGSGSNITATYTIPDTLGISDSATISIHLIVLAGGTTSAAYTNHAEIGSVNGIAGEFFGAGSIGQYDFDSDPDNNPTNDKGADATNAGSPADNVTTGTGNFTGSGVPGDGIAATDEDDADPALVPLHDVALIKTLVTSGSVDIGDLVTFRIKVFNQGNSPLDSIKVTDFIPTGYSFIPNNNWVASGSNACLTATIGNGLIPGSGVLPGDSIMYNIDLTVISAVNLVNVGEVTEARDKNGLTQTSDPDSKPNGLGSGGGAINTGSDNSINGNGTGAPGSTSATTDEDDADPATVQLTIYSIGNLVWKDKNNDGKANPGEDSIPGVAMELYKLDPMTGTFSLVAMDTTDAMGKYLFDSLLQGKYIVLVSKTNFNPGQPLNGLNSSSGGNTLTDGPYADPANPALIATNGDNNDNGYINPAFNGAITSDTIMLMKGAAPIDEWDSLANVSDTTYDMSGAANNNSDLTIDFGFFPSYSLGNLVWIDLNNNGKVDPTESGVNNVLVILHLYDPIANTCITIDSMYTDPSGKYLFSDLGPGRYLIEVAAENFASGGSLAHYVSSNGAGTNLTSKTGTPYEDSANPNDPNNNLDNDDNGIFGTGAFPNSVISDTIDLFGNEPTMEFDSISNISDTAYDQSGAFNSNSNLSIDFGFVPLHSIGNQIFVDLNNDGKMNPGEDPIQGVKIILHYYNPDSMKCFTVDSLFTDSNGKYVFDSLIAGKFIIEVAASNFGPGGALRGFMSSTGGGSNVITGPNELPGAPIDADTPADSADHGVAGTGMFLGSVISDTLNLGSNEPTSEPFDTTATASEFSNLTIDFGFISLYSIGNQVWTDTNNDGIKQTAETAIPGVILELHLFDSITQSCTIAGYDTTDANGLYLFDSLLAGKYIVALSASNFNPGGVLAGYVSSNGLGSDLATTTGSSYEDFNSTWSNDSTNLNDNGVKMPVAGTPLDGLIASDTINLGSNEPLNDTIPNNDPNTINRNSNLSIDFGLLPIHSIGNAVWLDANNNGKKDIGEVGIDSVLIILHYYDPLSNSCIALDSLYTDANGGYIFDSLVAGKYLIEIAASNFLAGAPLEKFASSSGSGATDPNTGPYEKAPDPDTNINNDDNGTLNGNPMFPGAVFSDTLDLNGNEPVSPVDSAGLKDTSGATDVHSNLTVDFGFFPLHSLGNQLFVDANNDGVMQPTESPIPGVKMILHYVDTTGGMSVCVTIDSVLTDANGKYVFDSLIAGKYIVEVAKSNFAPGGPLAAYASSTGGGSNTHTGPNEVPGMPIDGDTPADNTDHGVAGTGMFLGSVIGDTVDLGNNEPKGEPGDTTALDSLSNLHMDFGFFPLHSLGNLVWEDANNNGKLDVGETPIDSVKIILHYYNAVTMLCETVDSVLTDANGGYLFDSLIAGTYLIEIAQSNFAPGGPLAGYASSSGVNGSATGPYEDGMIMSDVDAINSDDNGTALPIGGVWSDSIKLAENEPISPVDSAGLKDKSGALDVNSNLTIDFGFYPLHSIGNLVWTDANNNGKVDAGEAGIANVLVILHYYNPATMACDVVDSFYTDATGGYLFDSLVAGKYLVEIAASNFLPGKPLNKFASSSGSGATDPNTGPYEKAPDPDTNINNDDNGTLNGNPMFPGAVFSDTLDLNGNEPVSPVDSAGLKDTSGATDVHSNLTVDFGFFPLHSLGNQLFVDANNDGKMQPTESPIPGVKMILHYVDTTGGMSVCVTIDSVLTDANGKYVFDSLIAGKYIVEVAKSNFAPGGPLAAYASSTGGGSNTHTGPNEVPGMPIDGDTPADSTDHGVAGTGMFLGSVIGDTVDLGNNEPKGEPGDTTALDSLSNLHMDFGFFPLHSLGNLVWEDANNNGKLDVGETPIDSVKIILHYYNAVTMLCETVDSVLTDANGGYLFDSLIAGTYLIEIAQSNFAPGGPLAGYASSSGVNGSAAGPYEDGMVMSDVDAINSDDNGTALPIGGVWSDSIKLAENEPLSPVDSAGLKDNSGAPDANSNLTIDFGFYPLHSIGNLVWTDANNNGKVDAGEAGIPNVLVILHYYNPATMACDVVDSFYTDATGGYLFDSLVAGKYLVEIAASNFLPGAPLEKFASSSGSGATDPNTGPYEKAPDPDTNIDSDDNGTLNGNPMFPGAVFSDTLDLNGNEPVSPVDSAGLKDTSGATDVHSNLTVDFGFFPLHSIGNQLFVDANNNGIKDPTEAPIVGVKMILHYVDTTGGMSVCVTIDSVLTDATGKYIFDSLIAGAYIVEVAKSNFGPGGVLQNYISSTGSGVTNTTSGPNEVPGMPIDADTPLDSADHGVAGTGMFLGSVVSDTLHLGEDEPITEPNDTTALTANSNLTLDFGFMEIFSLGNQVFADRNNNGIFDNGTGDIPISGVVMELHMLVDNGDGGFNCVIVAHDTTDGNGLYLFDSLLAGRYVVAISGSNFQAGGVLFGAYNKEGSTGSGVPLVVVPGPYETLDPNANPNWKNDTTDNNDNGNLMPVAGTPLDGLIASDTIDLGLNASEPLNENPYNDSTVTDDHNNLTIDFGLVPLHSIGNQVWADVNNNGIYDPGELPLDSVEVVLHYVIPGGGGCLAVDTLLTDANGKYLFGYLIEGQYIIEITAKNFLPGGALAGYASSTAGPDLTGGPYETLNNLTDGDRDTDNVDHGIKNLNSTFPVGSVSSDTITIKTETEPILEIDPATGLTDTLYDTTGAANNNSNLTIDFGFVPLHSIGNQVFMDFDNDGKFTPGLDLPPFGPVKVVLHYVDTTGGVTTCVALDTTFTDGTGAYLFDSLRAGKYIIEITADNFGPGAPLEGFFSSTGDPGGDIFTGPYENGTAPSGNTNIDGDDNGVLNRYPGFFPGSVVSDTIGIDDDVEPLAATETVTPNNDFSGALDKNSNLTIDFGFLVPCYDLTCIGQVNISLDQNCQHQLSAKEVLKAKFVLPDKFYTIEIFDAGGRPIPNPITRAWLGYELTYKITSKFPCDVNSCWGKLKVEDKYPPNILPTVDTLTCFELSKLPSGTYKVADNCSDSATVQTISESFTDYGCDSARVQGLVVRQLIATDVWGNTANVTKKIYIRKISIDSVHCPLDILIECGTNYAKDKNGNPDPSYSGAPTVTIKGQEVSLWPNSPSCKLEVFYHDERQTACGTSYKILRTWTITDWCSTPAGKDSICKQWIEIIDKTSPVTKDTILPVYYASPHDCGQYVDLPALNYKDCNAVTQTYTLKYQEEGVKRVLTGSLPASHLWLPTGLDSVEVSLVDACNNRSAAYIIVGIIDNTPPTPVCDEYTQVTVDPTSCWSAVAAADLDNGSHDNCCGVLHFAAAKMDSIVYWRNYWNTRLETEVGKTDFWKDKADYDAMIEDWINCYVFSDTVHFDECGTNQVVLRVYEACGVPRLDTHIWPCSPHAWFCYNTYLYIGDFNYNWFDPKGPHSCNYRPELTSLAKENTKYFTTYVSKGYMIPRFFGAAQFNFCKVPFYFGQLGSSSKLPKPNGGYCSARLYNDCMVNVLVDDKQAPVVDHLEDVTVYCDGAPEWADYPDCNDKYPPYPGELRDSKGVVHGYYGGSSQYDVHMGTGDHDDPQACDQNKGWAPIYCKNWLYLDSFDQAGKVNPSDYFEKPVLVDKKRPLDHTLKANEFTFTDNCRLDDATLTVTNNGTINGCGEGWISRTWTIKDKCGNAVSATQKIIVKHRSDFEVIFPADKKVTCDPEASGLNRTDTSALGAGKPILSDDDCEQLGVTYKDEIYSIVDSACYKIVRTWTIIDWCIYNANQSKRYSDVIVDDRLRANETDRACVYRNIKDNNDGYMQYVQIIKVIDEVKPKVTCSDQTICINDGCSATVNIPLVGTDNCADQVIFRVDITRPDGSHEKRSDITAITGSNFTAGAYKIQIIGKDRCGNEDTCNMTLTIKDCKKPTPYCLNGIATVVMPSTGSIEVWAKDFDKGASDNCTEASKLKFSFTKNTADASKILTCANIPNGKEQPINVEVWVTDEAGNQDFCSTYILLQDNGDASKPGGACKDTAALIANITGKLLTEDKEGVEFANVDVKGMQGIPSIKTTTDGSYVFTGIPMTEHVSIKALRDDNPMNGVSTLDLVLIQKHIMGTETLKSAYKMIAADVDNNNDITAIDLLELRKLILGIYDKLPSNTSWKFIPKSYTFSDASNPWGYPTEDVLTEMNEKMVRDFVGVKIGDVNSSAVAHSLMGTEIRSGETGLIFEVQDQVFKAGDKVSVEFRSPNFKGVSGFQGTMNFTIDKLQFDNLNRQSSIVQSAINFTERNVGRRWEQEGMITMSWNTNTSMDIKDEAVLFTMHFTAQSAGRLSEVLRIGSQHTIAESYEGKGELGNLSIRFIGKDGKEVAGKSELYQNYPNPFDQRTVIGLNLAEGVKGNLKITDVTGRTVKTISKDWSKGYNEIWLNRSELQATGILFYSFESKDFTATKRMIILQ